MKIYCLSAIVAVAMLSTSCTTDELNVPEVQIDSKNNFNKRQIEEPYKAVDSSKAKANEPDPAKTKGRDD